MVVNKTSFEKLMKLLLVSGVLFTYSCANQDSTEIKKRKKSAGPATENVSAEPKTTSQETLSGNNEVKGSGASLQVKNASLLSSSLVACLGEGVTLVKEPMIIDGINATGFLSKELYKVSSDAILVAGKDLLSQDSENRLSTNSDGLSLNYLGAIHTIADVASENCSASNPLCQCATLADAKTMMARCLPGISPKHELYESVANDFHQACLIDPKKAIASMLASYAFIISR
jgi:hypothetical protein